MQKFNLNLIVLVVLLALVLSAEATAAQSDPHTSVFPQVYLPAVSNPGPLPSHEVPLTVRAIEPQSNWTAMWWKWATKTNDYLRKSQGYVDCGWGQLGNLWFLAGTLGYGQPVVRQCKIPLGKTLLAPLQTAAWHNEGDENLTVEEKRKVLDEVYSDSVPGMLNSKICVLESSVNGSPIAATRVQSPPFANRGDPAAVSDGYWYAFQLPPGEHEVRFKGTLCNFDDEGAPPIDDVDVVYKLLVKDDPPSPYPWQAFVWDTDKQPAATGCKPNVPGISGGDPTGVVECSRVGLGRDSVYAGTPPWTFTAPSTGAKLTVVALDLGWVFEIFDNGKPIGETPPRPTWGGACWVPEGGDPAVCLENPHMSSGTFTLEPGSHSITILPSGESGISTGYFRFD